MQFRSAVTTRRTQAGFTLIELVSVIVLLGILVAVALPRFINVSEQAHRRVYEATYSSMITSLSLFHLLWEAQGRPAAGTTLPGFGSATGVAVTGASGFPAGAAGGDGLLDSDAECVEIFNALLQAGHATVQVGIQAFGSPPPAAEVDAYTTHFATRYGYFGFDYGCGFMFVGGGSAFNGGLMPVILYPRSGSVEEVEVAPL